jgi:hypothetical protein
LINKVEIRDIKIYGIRICPVQIQERVAIISVAKEKGIRVICYVLNVLDNSIAVIVSKIQESVRVVLVACK